MISMRAQVVLESLKDVKAAPRPAAPVQKKKALCKGCGAEIFWVRTRAGKSIPLNTKRKTIMTPNSWTVDEQNHTTVDDWILVSGYESHFATCLFYIAKAASFKGS